MPEILFPDGNEDALLQRAKALGWKDAMLVYQSLRAAKEARDALRNLPLRSTFAALCSPEQCAAAKAAGILGVLRSEGDDRAAIERGKPSLLFGMEGSVKRDSPHQRLSGFNHVIAAAAARHGTAVGFALSSYLSLSANKRPTLLGRWMQNITVCRKEKVPMVAASFASAVEEIRAPADLASFFAVLGMARSEFLGGHAALRG